MGSTAFWNFQITMITLIASPGPCINRIPTPQTVISDVYARNRTSDQCWHDDVIKWEHFPRYWPFMWGIHRSPVNSPHKGQWRRALMFSMIWAWTNVWVNNQDAGDLRRHRAHYDVFVMDENMRIRTIILYQDYIYSNPNNHSWMPSDPENSPRDNASHGSLS